MFETLNLLLEKDGRSNDDDLDRKWLQIPTGPKHYRDGEACRCMIGEDHAEGASAESPSVWDAADIWLSNGMDEDYTFGYGEDELRRAAGPS